MVALGKRRRQSEVGANAKREDSFRHLFAKRNTLRVPDAVQHLGRCKSNPPSAMTRRINASAVQRAPSATPRVTGCSAVALQRQPSLSVFLNAKAFSILIRCDTGKLSRLAGAGCALPVFRSQQVAVPLDATGAQAAKGESTIISTSAVTSALCSATSLSISSTRMVLRKSPQLLAI